jgi:hypothetical protein
LLKWAEIGGDPDATSFGGGDEVEVVEVGVDGPVLGEVPYAIMGEG